MLSRPGATAATINAQQFADTDHVAFDSGSGNRIGNAVAHRTVQLPLVDMAAAAARAFSAVAADSMSVVNCRMPSGSPLTRIFQSVATIRASLTRIPPISQRPFRSLP
ncbi:MAG: hypothetical protein V4636_13485 [Pseudomonadota bacterium]